MGIHLPLIFLTMVQVTSKCNNTEHKESINGFFSLNENCAIWMVGLSHLAKQLIVYIVLQTVQFINVIQFINVTYINPEHTYLEVSSFDFSGTYFQVSVL